MLSRKYIYLFTIHKEHGHWSSAHDNLDGD